jgi:hypothetical protein
VSRRIEKDGKFFRIRRGKLVQIPIEWVGVFPHSSFGLSEYRFWKRFNRRKERRQAKTDIELQLQEIE